MAKVYQIDLYRLKRELKELRQQLDSCLKHAESVGFNWIEHYKIRELQDKIFIVKQKIEDEQQRHS